jgi:1-acyl-sn-glycerol-3-phosphate acyltransferase
MIVKFFYSFSPFILQRVAWPLGQAFFFLLHLEYRGVSNVTELPRNKRVIFAANHTSELDPILVTACMPFFSRFLPLFYVSRSQKDYRHRSIIKRLMYGGLFFKLWGAFPAFSGHKDYEKSLTHHLRILKMDLPVLIFPEGGIVRGGVRKEAHGGVIYLARATEAVIIPVHISGTSDITNKDFFTRKRHCRMTFGKPIDVLQMNEPKTPEEYKSASSHIVDTIYSL